MNDKRYLFRGFHPRKNGDTSITLNGEEIRGEWIYGSLLRAYFVLTNTEEYMIVHHNDIDFCYDRVLSKTVGQWVIEDKNGKDIFDYDIVRDKNGNRYIVIYDRFKWVVMEEIGDSYAVMDIGYLEEIELIGNKWEVTE